MSSPPRRASALSAEERRAALITATLPLVLDRGTDVSTREIAEAAGVAEGTIFRVFPTKQDLLDAVVAHAFDPTALLDGLRRIDPAASLEHRLTAAVALMQQRSRQIWHLLHAVGTLGTADHSPRRHSDPDGPWTAIEALITDAVAMLIEPDRDRLRCGSLEAARRLRLVTLASGHPRLAAGDQLSPEDTVSLLLDGLRARPEASAAQASATDALSPIGVSPC
jgi:AcrR family transcriptional regulator